MLQRIRSGEIRNIRDAREAGFTLIELLIVIVVLGVLAGIVVFGVSTFKTDSETAACKADVKTVGVAADAYTAKTGSYPATVAALVSGGYLKATPGTTVTLDSAAKTASATCGGSSYSA